MNAPNIRIMVVDDHVIVRDGLRELINSQRDFEFTGDSGDGQDALEKIQFHRPDVVIVDIAMPGMDGLGLCGLLREVSPHTKIVIFSMHQKEAYVKQALNSGAMGYVLKSSPTKEQKELGNTFGVKKKRSLLNQNHTIGETFYHMHIRHQK